MRIKLYISRQEVKIHQVVESWPPVVCNIYLVNSKQKAGFEFQITAGILSLLTYVRNESTISAARRTLLYGVVGASVVEGWLWEGVNSNCQSHTHSR